LTPFSLLFLHQFREVCADLLRNDDDDYYCLRWLRARNFDIQQAKEMLKKASHLYSFFHSNLAWRKSNNIDSLLKEYKPSPFLQKHLIGGLYGIDKNGGPVWIYPFANLSIKALMRGCTAKDILTLMAYRCEVGVKVMEEQTKKLGKHVETQTVIFDFAEFAMMQALTGDALAILSGFLRMYEANYPERLQHAFVINVPSLFSVFFNLVKPLLNGTTLQKVSVYGKDQWKDAILKHVDADQLPKHWGGDCVDEKTGDPRCDSHITVWTPIREDEYVRRNSLNGGDSDSAQTTTVSVERRSCLEVPVTVDQGGSRLCWQYETEDHDIGFSVTARATGSDDEVVVQPWEREDSHLQPRDGSLFCQDAGT
ncbi:unnamed protein product, partial [Ixodes hexagonus]